MTAKTTAIVLGLLVLAVAAAPAATAEETEPQADEGPCDFIETMLWYPYVVLHPECLEEPWP